jgi:SAM-dependent methyltransferase
LITREIGSMSTSVEPASFRDPSSTVYYQDGAVLRSLVGDAVRDWELLAKTRFFARRQADGSIVRTEPVEDAEGAPEGSQVVLRHDRVPFISYPYVWTFAQLRDAALLHLDVMLEALEEGMTMKDGYSYNLQFVGARPTFIDTPSFEKTSGGPWAGYKQFCQTLLYPLILQAYKDVTFRPWLRGAINGIEPRQIANLVSARDIVRPGVLKHVTLHSAMDKSFSGKGKCGGSQSTKEELARAGFSDELTKATVKGLRKVVAGLKWKAADSHWATYQQTSTYSDDERVRKAAFVRAALADQQHGLVWDLGCNDGTYSRIAAETSDYVLAVDGDEVTIDSLYRALRAEGNTAILPLVMDLVDQSPGIGWRNTERPAFAERGKPDAVLCLALVHHLAITASLPLPAILDWFHSLRARLVIEFVAPDDPMGKVLLANKPAGLFPDYRASVFEVLLEERFEIQRQEALPSGTRTLYSAVPRA